MAMILPVLSVIGTVVSVIGAIQQGKAAKKAADYNATINLQNAQIARDNAQQQALQQDRQARLRIGAINAGQGKSGGTSEGSVLDVIGDVAGQNELERQNILYGGELTARGYTNTATLDTAQGKQAQQSSYYKAGGELLTGGASTYNQFALQGSSNPPVTTRPASGYGGDLYD